MHKELILGFITNLLAVILGIVITFAVQGMIDRARDRREVRSALELVRSELASNLDDIAVLDDHLHQEQASARYLTAHEKDLDRCPLDSVNYHTGVVYADVSVALSHDALELLKMSSLFPKIGDNSLSMKIIRAYDTCELMVANISRHFAARDAHGAGSVRWLAGLPDPSNYTDATDIRDALDAIDRFLRKRR